MNGKRPAAPPERLAQQAATNATLPRPAEICRQLLAALGASEGRRRQRKRDTRPDAIGLSIKRRLLEEAVAADPEPEAFEGWLLQRSIAGTEAGESAAGTGALGEVWAMALEIRADWRQALSSPSFRKWLREGAPSADALSEESETPD